MALEGTRASLPAYGHTITRDYDKESKGGAVNASLKDFDEAGIPVKDLYGSPALIREMQENPEKTYNLQVTKYQDSAPVLRPLFTMGIALIGAFMGADGMADVLDTSSKDFSKIRDMLNKHGQPNDWGWGFSMHFTDYVISEIPPKEKPPEVEKKKEQDADTVETLIVPAIPKKPPRVFESTVFFTVENQPVAEDDKQGVNKKELGARGKAVGDLALRYRDDILAGKPLPFTVDVLVADSTSASESYNHGLSGSRLVSDRIKTAQATYDYLVKVKGMKPEDAVALCDKMFGLTALGKALKVEGNAAEQLCTQGLQAKTGFGYQKSGNKLDIRVEDVCLDHSDGLGTRYLTGKGEGRDKAVSAALKDGWGGTETILWKANEAANGSGTIKFEDTNRVVSTEGGQKKQYTPDRGSTLRIMEPADAEGYAAAKAHFESPAFAAWLAKLPPEKQAEAKKAAAGILKAHQADMGVEKAAVDKRIGAFTVGVNNLGEGLGKHAGHFSKPDVKYFTYDYPHEVGELVEMVGEHNAYLLLSGKDPEKEPGLFKDLPPGVKALPERTGPDGLKTRSYLPHGVKSEADFTKLLGTFGFHVEKHGETGRLGQQVKLGKGLEARIGEADKEIGKLTGGKPAEAMDPKAAETFFQVAQFGLIEEGFKKDSAVVGGVVAGKAVFAPGAEKKLNANLTVYKGELAKFEKWMAENPEAVKAYDAAHPDQPPLSERVAAMKKGTPPSEGSPAGSMGLASYERALVSGKSEAVAADTTINAAHGVADATPLAKPKGSGTVAAPKKVEETKPTKEHAEALEREGLALARKGDVVGANKKFMEASETYRKIAIAADPKTPEGKKVRDEAIAGMRGIPNKALEAGQAYEKYVADKEKGLPPDQKTPPYIIQGNSMTFMSTAKFALESIPTLTGKPIKTKENMEDLALDIEMEKVKVNNLKKSHPGGVEGMKADKARLEGEIADLEASGKDPEALKAKKAQLAKIEGTLAEIEKGEAYIADLEKDYDTGVEVHLGTKESLKERSSAQFVQAWVAGWNQTSAALMQWANEILSKATGKQIKLPTDMDRIVNAWGSMNTIVDDITARNKVMQASVYKMTPEKVRDTYIDGALARRPEDAAKYKPYKEEMDAQKVEKSAKIDVSGTTKEVKGVVLSDEHGVKSATFEVGGKTYSVVRGEDGKYAFSGKAPQGADRVYIEQFIAGMDVSKPSLKKVKEGAEKGFAEALAAAPPSEILTMERTEKVSVAGGPSGEVKGVMEQDKKGLKSATFEVGGQTYTLVRGENGGYHFAGKAPTGEHKALIEGFFGKIETFSDEHETIKQATVKAFQQALFVPAGPEPVKA